MSGIAGIFYRNNRPVRIEQLEDMGKALSHRGPDGISYYWDDSIGLVHCMLHDTPESLLEVLPQQTHDKRLIITFHGRIDNRLELSGRSNWRKSLSETTDSDLVLAAYEKWGNGCAEYLLGDFAFAIWDEKEQKLFCARDHMGVKPFYYYLDDECFAFASEIKGILALAEIPRVVNEVRVADYLTSIVVDKETTFYKGILRLPPGCYLLVYPEKAQLASFHEFTPTQLQCTTDYEYEEQFREIFLNAVRCRLRATFPVGAYLSGGLDSSSITCAVAGPCAKDISGKLQTFSGIFDEIVSCDERQYFLSVIEKYGLISNQLPIDKINPAIAYEQLILTEDEPFMSPHIFMSMSLFALINEAKIRVLLCGHDGDAAVSYGYNLLSELALSGKFIPLVHCYRQAGFKSIYSIVRRVVSLYWNILCNKIPISSNFSLTRKDIVQSAKILNPEFARRTGIIDRLINLHRELPAFYQKEREFHKKNISQPIQSFALEIFERIAIREGVTVRYPYFDRRVIEFCMGLPSCQKFKEGFNRSIARRAMDAYLPKEISRRKTKTDFTPSLLNAFQKNDQGWLLLNIDSIDKSNYDYIDRQYVASSLASYKKNQNPLRQLAHRDLLTAVIFSRWMAKNKLQN